MVRLSRALTSSECSTAPAPGADTTFLAETLLERAERLVNQHHDHHHTLHPHHFHSLKLRRERSCHDIPIKDTTAMFNLQRRIRVLRDQLQKKDLQNELLKRKLALIEEGARGKCFVQVSSIFCYEKNGKKLELIFADHGLITSYFKFRFIFMRKKKE